MTTSEAPRIPRAPTWTLGDRMAKARTEAGLTQEQMAVRFGLSESTIAKWEGDVNQPRRFYDRMREWAEITNVPLSWLLGVGDSDVRHTSYRDFERAA